MPTADRKLKVFLCHAKEDKPAVRDLYRQLTAEGWMDVWLDEIKLLPGQNWDIEIKRAVKQADVVVVCLSNRSVQKEGYVKKEMRFVLDVSLEKPEDTIFVVPVRLDDCPVPERLQNWHWVDYFPKNNQAWAYQRLIESLKLRAGKLGVAIKDEKPKTDSVTDSILEGVWTEIKSDSPLNMDEYIEHVGSLIKDYKTKKKRTPSIQIYAISGVAIIAFLILVFGTNYLFKNIPAAPKPTKTPFTPSVTVTSQVIITLPTLTPIPEFGIGSTQVSDKDGMTMMFVPAGEFTMGSDSYDIEKPIHQVTLDAYWIDQTEVTNAMYAKCVADGMCKEPIDKSSDTHSSYYGNSAFDNYPVTYVDWNMASTYCAWAGRSLPTEAQWEKAARGTDGRTYPWGNDAPNKDLLNYNSNIGDTTKVVSYESGKSPYGLYDMAGNVWEWVWDWFSFTYYQNSPTSNPLGPDTGQWRVLRGGSWNSLNRCVRSAARDCFVVNPDSAYGNFGFRCAHSSP